MHKCENSVVLYEFYDVITGSGAGSEEKIRFSSECLGVAHSTLSKAFLKSLPFFQRDSSTVFLFSHFCFVFIVLSPRRPLSDIFIAFVTCEWGFRLTFLSFAHSWNMFAGNKPEIVNTFSFELFYFEF